MDKTVNLIANQKPNGKIIFKTKTLIEIVNTNDIIFIKANRGYCKFYCTENKTFSFSKPLKYFEDQLAGNNIFRCHRSFAVNTNIIQTIDRLNNTILLKNNKKIPISRGNFKKIIDYFNS